MSCTVLAEIVANTSYMNCSHEVKFWLPTMQDQKSLTLHWRSFSGWGREGVAIDFASEGSQYLIYRYLQPIAT